MENKKKVPYIGATVVFHPGDHDPNARTNRAEEIPAIIVSMFGKPEDYPLVNLKCFPDGTGTLWRTSVVHQRIMPGGTMTDGVAMAQGPSWRWPDEKLCRGTATMDPDNEKVGDDYIH